MRKKAVKEVKEKLPPQGLRFQEKFFCGDRLALEGWVFLRPQGLHRDIGELDYKKVGHMILEEGKKLRDEGVFPGGNYVPEDSLEFNASLVQWEQALDEVTTARFTDLVYKASKNAEAAFGTIGQWGPRLAALRWLCCMWWIAARAQVTNASSVGATFGTMSPMLSAKACERAKGDLLDWVRNLIHEAPLLKVFDFDLIGNGVYMNQRAEPLPRGGQSEWFRRQMQFDIASVCRQLNDLPPESLNVLAPYLPILRPYGEHTWELPPPDALRAIISKHDWRFEALANKPPDVQYDEVVAADDEDVCKCGKVWKEGARFCSRCFEPKPPPKPPPEPTDDDKAEAKKGKGIIVAHLDVPPPYEFDLTDPEIIAMVQRGDDLGKGTQEDGLPGAIHGSIGLLYAGITAVEKVENVRIYPDLLAVDDFLQCFLLYSTPLVMLDLTSCLESMDEEIISLLPLAGPSLQILHLEHCGIDGMVVETLVDTLTELTGLQHLNLCRNELDAPSATMLLGSLAERRVDLVSMSLGDNPLGDPHDFRQDVAGILAARGDQVVAGGELVLYLGVDGVRWFAEPRANTLAARRRDDTLMLAATCFDELADGARARDATLDEMFRTKKDPRTRTEVGQEILRKERLLNAKILTHSLINIPT